MSDVEEVRYVAQWQIPSVGLIAPEFELVRGVADVNRKEGQNRKGYVTVQLDENGELSDNGLSAPRGPIVSLKEQREQGHVVLFFMRAFY